MSKSTYTAHAIAHYSDAIEHLEHVLHIVEYAIETGDVKPLVANEGIFDQARELVRDAQTIESGKPLTAGEAFDNIRTDLRDILRKL